MNTRTIEIEIKEEEILAKDYKYIVDINDIGGNNDYVHAPDTSMFVGFPFGKLKYEDKIKAQNGAGFKFFKILRTNNPKLIADGIKEL